MRPNYHKLTVIAVRICRLINILQQILFSDFVVFAMMALVLAIISSWAYSLREVAGYLLGWLVGVFLILVLATLIPYVPPPLDSAGQPIPNPLTFGELIIPSFLGLVAGFGVLLVVRIGGYSDSRIRRALTVTTLMAFTLVTGYVILRSTIDERMGLAVFVLTFAIGALINFILTRGMRSSYLSRTQP
jgi:hypothetical protein